MTRKVSTPSAAEIFGAEPSLTDTVPRVFCRLADGHYQLRLDQLGLSFDVDRLRRKSDELIGELVVRATLAGARTFDGVLSAADFNLSSLRARQERGRYLAERAQAPDLDWGGLLEEFCQRVLTAERTGQPAVILADLPALAPEPEHAVLGWRFPRQHAGIPFGDGGTLKSLWLIYVGGILQQRGESVLIADWELDASTHRDRLGRLFAADLPAVRYVRCDRPLIYEVDRLARIIQQDGITFAVFDSIGYATDGPPEAAEGALGYFRAVRQLGIGGSLHAAHINRSENGDQRPFGSTFYHNSARATWYVKLASTSADGDTLNLALFPRKSNLGRLHPAVGLQATFSPHRITFSPIAVEHVPDLADHLPLWQRIRSVVKAGPQTLVTIAKELDHANVDSLDRIVRRHRNLFQRVDGSDGVARIALVERRGT